MFSAPEIKSDNAIFKVFTLAVITISISYLLNHIVKLRKCAKLIPSLTIPYRYVFYAIQGSAIRKAQELSNGYPVLTLLLLCIGYWYRFFKDQKMFCAWAFYTPFVFVVKPEAIEEVMSGTKFNQKGWIYNWLHCWLGTGLLTSHGEKWRSRRKILTPAFHFDILKDFLPTINDKSKLLVRKLEKETTKDYVDITTLVSMCSLDIICETTLGVNIKAQENTESEYVKTVTRVTDTLASRILNIVKWFDFLFFHTIGRAFKRDLNFLHKFTLSVIEEKKKNMLNRESEQALKIKRKPLIDVLLEHHINLQDLTSEDIREEVDTFTFEGHDTTAVAMTWALYLIGLYPEVQDKVCEELYQIFGDDTERPVVPEDLRDMKYLECVLKESLRLYPSVPFITRRANKDTTICGYPILKNMQIIISPYELHRDEEIYPNPEVFDPSRFTPENSANRHHYAYIPFAAGSRNCIGQKFAMMEEKVVVANILRNYTLRSLDSRDIVLPFFELMLRPAKPVRIRIRPRDLKRDL